MTLLLLFKTKPRNSYTDPEDSRSVTVTLQPGERRRLENFSRADFAATQPRGLKPKGRSQLCGVITNANARIECYVNVAQL